jgi:hypothetical protein
MIEASILPESPASLSARLVRRNRPPALVASPSRALVLIEAPARATSGWSEDLRFFAICYLAGFVFFLIMLS